MNKRRILIFAHLPPPHHGQSVMVQVLLEGLRADPRFEVHHVDARLSDDLEDIGSFRPQKVIRLLKCILRAWWIRLWCGRMAFYYVPAPAKRSAIVRDWVVLALCRPIFPELILHWHAYGLGEWVSAGGNWPRKLTKCLLGKANLAVVLTTYNKRDAEVFSPTRTTVVPNGIADQFPDYDVALAPKRKSRAGTLKTIQTTAIDGQYSAGQKKTRPEVVRFLFLGHLIESKGVFVAIDATRMVNEKLREAKAEWRAHLTLAGSFADAEERSAVFTAINATNDAFKNEGPCITMVGFLDDSKKKSAIEQADCLLFPTFYEGETQGLVLLEAMSAGLPVIASSWRGVPEALPKSYPFIINVKSASNLATAMLDLEFLEFSGLMRSRFESAFSLARHFAALVRELGANS